MKGESQMKNSKVNQFLYSIKRSLETENWFSALFISLAIPDICGGIEDNAHGKENSHGDRYKQWLDENLQREYSHINNEALWELRNSFFHTGTHIDKKLNIKLSYSDKEDAELLPVTYHDSPFHDSHIKFGTDVAYVHFRIDIFCKDICNALEEWLEDVKDDEKIQTEIDNLFDIEKNPEYLELVFGDVNLDWQDKCITGLSINRPDEEKSDLIKFLMR